MKIVVRGTNWIGDAVMSIPAMRELRRVFPESEITLLTRSWAEGLFRDADFIDEILTFDHSGSTVARVMAEARMLRRGRFDTAVIFPNSFASALPPAIARIPRRFGYSRDARRLLLTDRVPVPEWKSARHEVFYYLNLVAAVEKQMIGSATVASRDPELRLEISDERRASAKALLARHDIDLTRPVIALAPGSSNSRAKRWPAERFAALNDMIQWEGRAQVVLIGSADEREVSDEVVSVSRIKPVNLAGATGLDEVAAILSVADLLVSNDIGPAHIAPAVGTRTIVIFGPTDPETTRPYSENAEVLRHPVECSPCMLRDCPIDHRCMTRISPADVFERVAALL